VSVAWYYLLVTSDIFDRQVTSSVFPYKSELFCMLCVSGLGYHAAVGGARNGLGCTKYSVYSVWLLPLIGRV
jgi:hypothetical protein